MRIKSAWLRWGSGGAHQRLTWSLWWALRNRSFEVARAEPSRTDRKSINASRLSLLVSQLSLVRWAPWLIGISTSRWGATIQWAALIWITLHTFRWSSQQQLPSPWQVFGVSNWLADFETQEERIWIFVRVICVLWLHETFSLFFKMGSVVLEAKTTTKYNNNKWPLLLSVDVYWPTTTTTTMTTRAKTKTNPGLALNQICLSFKQNYHLLGAQVCLLTIQRLILNSTWAQVSSIKWLRN